MRVTVDQEKCCGSGNCVMTVPEVFDQRDSDGIVVLLRPDPPAGHSELVHQAAARCPCAAIQLDGEPPR